MKYLLIFMVLIAGCKTTCVHTDKDMREAYKAAGYTESVTNVYMTSIYSVCTQRD
jgi:hypothetical protein